MVVNLRGIFVALGPVSDARTMAYTRRNASLAALALNEKPEFIAAGVTWGQTVADAIWAWRLTDGFAPTPPPFFGVQSITGTPNSLGYWRPTPPANASGATPQIATMTPWVDATVAVPLAATTGPQQPGVRRRSQRGERDGQPLQRKSLKRTVRDRIVLGAEHTPRLEPCCGAA